MTASLSVTLASLGGAPMGVKHGKIKFRNNSQAHPLEFFECFSIFSGAPDQMCLFDDMS